ncbi:helix-turn-helix domain-containing protein [Streptomyces sp. PSKA54]|uniref:Helix-turn-helix domain-containing protein n=1 Tax=Streptomyces himalayensis subsp. aureolus TaxID=2758039 RepID=A0A7W2CXH3_9ACTN|nr:helix-turn-helix transcriptional regulator [Streptomyces himalayensis]MBA4860937.1 helix-turn-helix domain-containing protein [Streptomyces himalayensis subsp. aureolus]
MALRTSTTERQRRLGAELRKLREEAGYSVTEGGEFIGMARAHLGHVEAGRTAIPPEKLRTLCRAYRCTREPLIEALVAMGEDSGKGWWTEYRHAVAPAALDLAELEAAADALLSYESLFIPGILQIADYTRSIFRSSQSERSEYDLDKAVRFRMERQRILAQEQPPTLHAVIHEAALHVRFGGAAVMRRQLLHLIRMAELPHVTIQVLPFTAEGLSAFSTPFLFAVSHKSALETVLVENPAASHYVHERDAVLRYRTRFDRLRAASLPPVDPGVPASSHESRDSLALIQHLLYSLQED